MIELLAQWIVVHSVDKREIVLNVPQITSMTARQGQNRNVHHDATCLINLADGKFVTTIETCDDVRRLIRGKE
jgi:hypothetical protein